MGHTRTSKDPGTEEGWVTVQEAHRSAGVSVSAIRKWYRGGVVSSKESPGPHGMQRLVKLDEIVARRDAWDGRPFADHKAPEGMLLVPMAEWQRALEALAGGMQGFHDLATQLAEARAASAAAEVKVQFLEDQLREARARAAVEAAQGKRGWLRRRPVQPASS